MKRLSAFLAGAIVVLLPFAAAAAEAAPNRQPAATAPDDPVEREYEKLLADDDAAREEIDRWIEEARGFEEHGGGHSQTALNRRIEEKLAPVETAYEAFLRRNPNHARARLAYGSFLNETGDETEAAREWEKARELDPTLPAAWNNLANYYGHRSPVKKAFEYYEKAIELDPSEAVYYWNFATTVYLFRKDAREHYAIEEQEVFDKALGLYRKALERDPKNFILASDYAMSYYGTNPPRWNDGYGAWQKVMPLARDAIERQGVHLHLARISIRLERFEEAKRHLDAVEAPMYKNLKETLSANLGKAMTQAHEKGGL